MKRKYLHVEVMNGILYVYADDKAWGAKTLSLEQMDNECMIGNLSDLWGTHRGGKHLKIHVKVPLKDFGY